MFLICLQRYTFSGQDTLLTRLRLVDGEITARATLALPYKPGVQSGQGAKLYRFDKAVIEDGITTVQFIEVSVLANNDYKTSGGHPYFLVVESGEPFELTYAGGAVQKDGRSSQTENEGYAFVSTMTRIDNDDLFDANQPWCEPSTTTAPYNEKEKNIYKAIFGSDSHQIPPTIACRVAGTKQIRRFARLRLG